jgi:hypothetical protein
VGEDRSSSVQFVLIQNNASDDYLVAGYRVIESGEDVNVVALDTIRVGDPVEVSMTFADGFTTIVLEDGPTRQERLSSRG